jgi:hypothetical protein
MGRNSMTRDDLMNCGDRWVRKQIPIKHQTRQKNTDSADEITRKCGKFLCPRCKGFMDPFTDHPGHTIWRCFGTGCPNNPDDIEVSDYDTKMIFNEERYWDDWNPKCIV